MTPDYAALAQRLRASHCRILGCQVCRLYDEAASALDRLAAVEGENERLTAELERCR